MIALLGAGKKQAIEDKLAKAVHDYMANADVLKFRRKTGEIVLGVRVKTYSPRVGVEFRLFSTLDTAYGVPLLVGLLDMSEDYRYVKPGECLVLGLDGSSKRLYGLVDKYLVGSGLGTDPGGATFVAVLCSIGGLADG